MAEKLSNRTKMEKNSKPVLITEDPVMKKLCSKVEKVAKTNTSVLITGESGTGKEVISRLIHYESGRNDCPFMAVNCASIPEGVIESELFGHEEGAFTGANKTKKGCFELADEGTLFLDEIGEMDKDVQAKLLRAVEYKTFRRVGGSEEIETNARIITATNKELSESIEKGEFRKDLFYRLSVIELHVPPLRDRKGDIPLLVDHFLNEFTQKHDVDKKQMSNESLQLLINYHWPGNVRQLRNVLERCVILCQDNIITRQYIPKEILNETNTTNGEISLSFNGNGHEKTDEINLPIGLSMEEVERIFIDRTLDSVDNNKSKAAKILGFSRTTLHNKLDKYNAS